MSEQPKQQRGKLAYVQKREDAKRKERERQTHEDNVAVVCALNRVADQLTTDEQEEERRDFRKACREYLTIFLVFATVVAAGIGDIFFYGQMREMQNAYGPIKEQAEAAKRAAEATARAADAATKQSEIATKQAENSDKALMQAQRAWVGPRNAALSAEPAVGKPAEISIEYQNSGREPALGFTYTVEAFLMTPEEDADGTALNKLRNYMSVCKNSTTPIGGGVVYPITGSALGGGGYGLTSKSPDSLIDEAVTKGDKILIIQGCFLYLTFSQPHHSYFCYFYKQGLTKIQTLNICVSGHDAD